MVPPWQHEGDMLAWCFSLAVLLSPLVARGDEGPAAPSPLPASSVGPFRGKGKSGGKAKAGKAKAPRNGNMGRGKAPAANENAAIGRVRFFVGRGQFRQAIAEAYRGLETDPQNLDLQAAIAVGCSEFGNHVCAVQFGEDGLGAESFQLMLLGAVADGYRMMGMYPLAINIRNEALTDALALSRELAILDRLFQDHWLAQDIPAMWDVAWSAMALAPSSPLPHAMVARVLVVEGRPEEALSYVWVGSQLDRDISGLRVAEVEAYLALGDPYSALAAADGDRAIHLKNPELAAVRGDALLAMGMEETVLDMLDIRSWYYADHLWNPDLQSLQAVALWRFGHENEALALLDELRRTYPNYWPAHARLAEIEVGRQAP